MDEFLNKLAENFGYVTPFFYATGAYKLFVWLDEQASENVKAALASTMILKGKNGRDVAFALVAVFDRFYTNPLLALRAFFRSVLFSTVITAVCYYEAGLFKGGDLNSFVLYYLLPLSFNIFIDYISLFAIRPFLLRSGSKPVLGLICGAAVSALIIFVGNAFRLIAILIAWDWHDTPRPKFDSFSYWMSIESGLFDPTFMWPNIVVFAWLILFALGIVAARLINPLSWLVGRAQLALKDGAERPLKAVGYVAAIFVFAFAVLWKTIFKT